MRVAIIGAGDMGGWLAGFIKGFGEVSVADIDERKARNVASAFGVDARPAEEAAKQADIIMIAVPISETPAVIKSMSRFARKSALLVDVASVKKDVVRTMRGIDAEIEMASLHPLFGPGASGVRDKDIVAVPVRPGPRYKELKEFFAGRGARITEMDEDTHDRLMAIIQCLTQFVLISYTYALKSIKDLKKAGDLRTPISENLMNLAKAILAGNPKVYGELQMRNEYAKMVRSSVIEACRSLDNAFSAGDSKTVEKVFKEALAHFGADEAKKAYADLYKHFEGVSG